MSPLAIGVVLACVAIIGIIVVAVKLRRLNDYPAPMLFRDVGDADSDPLARELEDYLDPVDDRRRHL